jgi:hypothetical protein
MFGFSSFSQVPYSTLSGITHEGVATIDGIRHPYSVRWYRDNW